MSQTSNPSFEILTGRTQTHVTQYLEKIFLYPEALKAFNLLKQDALKDGIQLEIISGFRNYDRQLLIWNNKVSKSLLAPVETIHSIMRWSALPGTSRHHWGTDIDVFDPAKLSKEKVKLEINEFDHDGPLEEINFWLTDKIRNNKAHGFYRPYDLDRGGVSPEPWHLSYKPVSDIFFKKFSLEIFEKNINKSEIFLKEEILNNLSALYQRYFCGIS